jgi:hypothetical protein
VRSVAKQTILAGLLAWLASRVLRRVVGVAVLAALGAGALGLAGHGFDLRDMRRV